MNQQIAVGATSLPKSWSHRLLKFCFLGSVIGNVEPAFPWAHARAHSLLSIWYNGLVLRLLQKTLVIRTVANCQKASSRAKGRYCCSRSRVSKPWFLLCATTYLGPDSGKHAKYWWEWFVLISIAFDSSWRNSQSWHTPASLNGSLSFLGENTQGKRQYLCILCMSLHTWTQHSSDDEFGMYVSEVTL